MGRKILRNLLAPKPHPTFTPALAPYYLVKTLVTLAVTQSVFHFSPVHVYNNGRGH